MHRRSQAPMSFVFEELEPRIMYSADFAPGLVDEAGWQPDTEVRLAEDATLAPSTQAEQRRKEIVFIDAAVEDCRALIDAIDGERGAQADLEFFLIDAEHDGVQQITAALDQRRGVAAVHIVSHGSEASLRLGSTMLDAQNLAGYAEVLQQWGGALAPDGDVLLYGCDVAESAQGAAFLRQIGALTGADVAASSDATGVAARGGDWELEQHFGNIEAGTIGASAAMESWGGLLGNEFLVNTTTNNDQDTSALTRGSQQAIAYDAAGNFVVVWVSKSQDVTGTDGVYARRFADDGTPLTGEILVNATVADDQNMARVVSDAAGSFVVTWTSNQQDGNGSGVYVRRFDANGVALSGEIAVNTTTSGDQENSVIAMNRSSGEFVVAWQGAGAGDADGIFFRRFAADGTASDATERRVNTSDSGTEGNPAVAMDTSGRFVVAFEVNNKMYFQRFDATGATAGGRTQVDNIASNSTGAAIAMDDAGNFTLVYREQNILTGVWGRGYMSDGTQRYTWFRPATGDASSPSIAMAGDGAFIVTYQRTGAEGIDIYAFKHNADGSENGTALIINQTTTNDQVAPSIALLSTDHFTVVWSGPGVGDSKGVHARSLSPANTAPVIGLSGAALNYVDGDGPTIIDAGASVADAESPNFSTGTLTVSFAANGSVHDRLLINHQGAASGQIGVSGNTITYGGITVGSFVGGTDGATPLVVTFNYAATPGAAQALLRNIQYHNVSGTPSTLTRTLQAVLTDGDGGTSNVATKSIQVADANQPPTSAGGSVTSVEDTARVFAWADFNVADADSPIGTTTAVRLTTLPAVDVLEYFNGRAWTRAGLGHVFTKADIDAGLLRLMPLADQSGYDGYASAGVGNLKQDYAQFSFTPIQVSIETIINPGGEADGLADGAWQVGATGWSQSGNNAGAQNLVASADTFAIDDDASLFVDAGGSLTQTLAATFSSARNYSLSFELGWRGDAGFYPTEPGFKIELYAGTTLLGEFNETYITGELGKFVAGVLAVDGSLSGATNGSALQIKLTGISTQANFDNLQLISFDRSTDIGAAAQMTVDVTPVNDAPVNSLPSPLSVNEDVALAIAGLSIADVDAATASTQLLVGNGTLNVNLAGGAIISAGANNSNSLTLTGTLAQVNAALATLSYQGNLNFSGSDSLQIVTNDLGGFGAGSALSDTDSVVITVNAVNDAPVIASNGGGASASLSVTENTPAVTSVSATDVDAQPLTYSIIGGADAANFSIDAATGALSFVAAPDCEAPSDAGADNVYDVIVQVSDGTLNDSQAIAVSVTAVNDNNPVIISNGGGASVSVSIAEGGTAVTTVVATDADLPAPALTYAIVGGADAAKFTINQATGALSFASAQNFEAPSDGNADNLYEVTVRASDGANSDTQNISVAVININEAPSIANQTFSFAENSANATAVGNVGASDVDAGDTLTYSITAGNGGGAFSIDATGQIQVANSAALNFEATPTFNLTVLVSDAGGLSNSAAITVNLTNVNEAPVNIVPGALSVNEDMTLPIAGVAISDVDGNIASVQASVANGKLNVSLAGGASISAGANGSASLRLSGTQAQINAALSSIVYQGNTNFSGGDVLTIVSSDAATLSDTSTVNITVNPLNDVPFAADDNYGVNENGSLTLGALGGVLSNDSDIENSVLSAALVSAPSNGTLALNANGSFVYTPNANFNGADSFTYRSSDGSLDSSIATVTITVSSVNTAPFIFANAAANVAESGGLVIDSGHLRVDDFDNSPAQIVYTLTNAPSNGVLTRGGAALTSGSQFTQQDIDANALWYTHDGGESIGDMFTFTVSDGLGGNIAATPFVFDIASVNDAPVITNNGGGASAALTVTENAVAVTTVAANDADLPVNTLSYAIGGGADAASFAIDGATGVLSFVTAPNFEAPLDANSDNMYEVIVRVDDGNGGTATQALHVSIANLNETPVNVLPGSLSATEDAPASIGGLSVADPDSNIATVSVSVAHGALNVDLAAGASISAGANASAALTLAGTQSQINAALASIRYAPSLNFSGNDNLSIVSVDSVGQTDADALAIDVAQVNDAPSIIAAQFTIAEGASITLSTSEIGAVDVEQNASQLSLTVSSIASGYLEFVDHPGAAITLFTQADIEAGRVRFIHDGGEAAPSLVIAVSDFVASDGPRPVAIDFANINDVPALAVGSASFWGERDRRH